MGIDSDLKRLSTGPNFGAFTTLLPNGDPSTHIMWVDSDDEHVLINTETHRQKYKNVMRDPRVCVSIWDAENPYAYVEVRGEVVGTILGQDAREHIDALARRYMNVDAYPTPIESERVILMIRPDRVRKNNL